MHYFFLKYIRFLKENIKRELALSEQSFIKLIINLNKKVTFYI